MRVLIVASEFPPGPGGIGTHAHQLAVQLHRLGRQVKVIASQDNTTDAEIAEFRSRQAFPIVRMKRLPGAPTKLAYRSALLAGMVRSWKPDVMVVSGDRESYAAALVAGRLPWICIEHGRKPLAGWERAVKRWSFGRASAVVAVSQYSRKRLLELGVRPKETHVIPNGADPESFGIPAQPEKPAVLAEIGVATGSLILSVGHVSNRKGQDILIAAMPAILCEVPDAHYIVVGKPTRVPKFRALAERLGVAQRVHFLGQVDSDRLRRLLGACELHVMTSRHTLDEFEGYGIAVVEAALCGKPSVVSGDSGLAEAVVDGETGLVTKLGDEVDTARAIIRLLLDHDLRGSMGEAAHRRALAEQTWAQRVKYYDELLVSLTTAA